MATIFESARQKVLDVLDSVLTAPESESQETDNRPVIERLQQRMKDVAEAAEAAAREESDRLSNMLCTYNSLKARRMTARKMHAEVCEYVGGATGAVESCCAGFVDNWENASGTRPQYVHMLIEFSAMATHGPMIIAKAKFNLSAAEKEYSDFVKTNRKDLIEMQLPID